MDKFIYFKSIATTSIFGMEIVELQQLRLVLELLELERRWPAEKLMVVAHNSVAQLVEAQTC